MPCVVRDNAGKLLLAAGWVGEYREISEAELRVAWESLRLMLLHLNGYYAWLEGDALSVVIQDLSMSPRSQNPSVLLEDADLSKT